MIRVFSGVTIGLAKGVDGRAPIKSGMSMLQNAQLCVVSSESNFLVFSSVYPLNILRDI